MCIPIHAILAYIPNDETVLVKISWPSLWFEPTCVFKYRLAGHYIIKSHLFKIFIHQCIC